mgnify:CR=1 FL=1
MQPFGQSSTRRIGLSRSTYFNKHKKQINQNFRPNKLAHSPADSGTEYLSAAIESLALFYLQCEVQSSNREVHRLRIHPTHLTEKVQYQFTLITYQTRQQLRNPVQKIINICVS